MKEYIITEAQLRLLESSINHLVVEEECFHNRCCILETVQDVTKDIRERDIPVAVRSSTSERNQTEEELQFLASTD